MISSIISPTLPHLTLPLGWMPLIDDTQRSGHSCGSIALPHEAGRLKKSGSFRSKGYLHRCSPYSTNLAEWIYSVSVLTLDLSLTRIQMAALGDFNFRLSLSLAKSKVKVAHWATHVDAILLFHSPGPRLLPRSSPSVWGLVWWHLPRSSLVVLAFSCNLSVPNVLPDELF